MSDCGGSWEGIGVEVETVFANYLTKGGICMVV